VFPTLPQRFDEYKCLSRFETQVHKRFDVGDSSMMQLHKSGVYGSDRCLIARRVYYLFFRPMSSQAFCSLFQRTTGYLKRL